MKWSEIYKKYEETAEILKRDYYCYFTELKRETPVVNDISETYIKATFVNEGITLFPIVDKINGFVIKGTIIQAAIDFKEAIKFFKRFKINFNIYMVDNEIWIESPHGGYYFYMIFDNDCNYLRYTMQEW